MTACTDRPPSAAPIPPLAGTMRLRCLPDELWRDIADWGAHPPLARLGRRWWRLLGGRHLAGPVCVRRPDGDTLARLGCITGAVHTLAFHVMT